MYVYKIKGIVTFCFKNRIPMIEKKFKLFMQNLSCNNKLKPIQIEFKNFLDEV